MALEEKVIMMFLYAEPHSVTHQICGSVPRCQDPWAPDISVFVSIAYFTQLTVRSCSCYFAAIMHFF